MCKEMSTLFLIAVLWGILPPELPAQVPEGQTPSERIERVTLAEAIRLLAVGSIELRIARQEFAAAEARVLSAGALPNPVLSVSREQLSGGVAGYDETMVTVGQPLELGGQRGVRRRAAASSAEAAAARLEGTRLRLGLAVREAYVRAAAATGELRTLEEAVAVFREVEESGSARFAEGDISRFDLSRLQIERARYETMLVDAALELDEAARALTMLVDPELTTQWRVLFPAETLAEIALPPSIDTIDVPSAAALRAEVRAGDAELQAAEAALDLQRRSRVPTLTLNGGFKHQSDDYRGAVLGVSLPLPLWDRNRGGIAEAAASLGIATATRDLAARRAEDEIRRAMEVRRSLQAGIGLLTGPLLAETAGLLETARLAYAEGELSLVELLDAADAHRGARASLITQLERYLLATYRLEYAAGRLPDFEPAETGIPR